MKVRRLTAGDVRPYRALMLEAYAGAPDAFTSTAEERASEPESWWVRRIEDPGGGSAAFGAFDGEVLAGTVALEFNRRSKTRHRAHLIGMYVAPAARGRGAADALVRAALDFARQRGGLSAVTLTVTQDNEAAVRLYRRAGFEAFGTEPRALLTPGGYKAKLYMWLAL